MYTVFADFSVVLFRLGGLVFRCVFVNTWLSRTSCTLCLRVVLRYCSGHAPPTAEHIRRIEVIYGNLQRAPVVRRRDPTRALKRHRIVTCVIWALSGSAPLAEAYLLSKGFSDTGITVQEYSPEGAVLLFAEWLVSEYHSVLAAVMDIENADRVEAGCFLVRSLTAMIVHVQSQKGVLVSTSESVFHYLRFWSLRGLFVLWRRSCSMC